MTRPDRFSSVAPLPPHGEWRRILALEGGAGAPRPVVLAFAPASVTDDPARLAALVRDVEAAARLHHPGAVPVLGTETVDGALAVVEAWRPGPMLRAVLDAGGRLPPDVAARLALDACAAVARAHALDAGEGRPLVHGEIAPSRVLIAEEGAALMAGFGVGGEAEPAADVRALAAVLHECLAGERPADPARPLDAPGVPPALAAAVDRALGAAPGGPFPSAAALAEAIAAAGPVASHADVAAYAEAIVPAEEGARAELARALRVALAGGAEEVSAELIVEPTDPGVRAPAERLPPPPAPGGPAEPTPEPLPRPPSTRPGADPAGVFAAPAPPAPRSRAPAAVAVACAVLGFALGFAVARLRPGPLAPPAPEVAATPSDAQPAARPDPPARRVAPPAPTPAGEARAEASKEPPAPQPKRAASRPQRRAAKAAPIEKGFLTVTAPSEAEVFVDGRRIGKGNVRIEVAVGAHRIEVRLGEARAAERFTLAPGETWTYDVTPTP